MIYSEVRSEDGDWIGGDRPIGYMLFLHGQAYGNCYRLDLAWKLRYPSDILEMDSWSVIDIILMEIFSEMRFY